MNFLRSFSLVTLAISVSACNVTMETDISLKELMHGDAKQVMSTLRAAVRCKDEDAVKEMREKVEELFAGAKYVACNAGGGVDAVEYRVPIHVFRGREKELPNNNFINLYSIEDDVMGLVMPRPMEGRLRRYEELGSRLRLNMRFKVTNDTGSMLKLVLRSVYADGQALVEGGAEFAPGESISIRLSDVLVDAIRQQGMGTFVTRAE